MFPLYDDNPRQSIPVVTLMIIGICVSIFLWQLSAAADSGRAVVLSFGLIPARFFAGFSVAGGLTQIPAWLTVFTSLFFHLGWFHLGSNMLFLWIFGDNVEDAMGHGRFIVFYVACGAAAAFAQVAANPSAVEPMVGASGAIAGVLGAYILLYPRAKVRTLVFLGIFVTFIRIPAVIVLGVWFAIQFWTALGPGSEGVAVWAHVGGFVAGLILVWFLKRPDVNLFQPAKPHPVSSESA
jgi:membrane associated rhomboid family serine protease